MRLMTPEEYRKTEWPAPYILKLKTPTGNLYYFGEEHSFDPKNPQWEKVKSVWQEFLNDPSQKKIVFVEGGIRKPRKTEGESILDEGGMGLISHLAHQAKIEIRSPEPERGEERRALEKEFSRDEIQYYYFARMVYQWMNKIDPKSDFEPYIKDSLAYDRMESGWNDYDFSLDHMKKIHEKILGVPFSLNNDKIFYDAIDPMSEHRIAVNDVSLMSGEVRDECIVNTIVEYIKKGYCVFAQFGLSHVIVQESSLRSKLS